MLKFFDDAKLKAAVWWRERKDKAEERKAEEREPSRATKRRREDERER